MIAGVSAESVTRDVWMFFMEDIVAVGSVGGA